MEPVEIYPGITFVYCLFRNNIFKGIFWNLEDAQSGVEKLFVMSTRRSR